MKQSHLITMLRRSGDHRLDPAVQQRLRERLLDMYRQSAVSQRTHIERPQPLRPRTFSLAFGLTAVVVLLTLGVATTVAAEGAKPGDLLYPWERGVEQVRLALTIGSEAKVEYEARLAEERSQEAAKVRPDAPNVERVQDDVSQALNHALERVVEEKEQQAEKGNTRAAESLGHVESRLKELKEQHDDRGEEDDSKSGLTEAEVKFTDGRASVKIVFDGRKQAFTLSTTDEAEIVTAISQRTGVTEAEVRSVLKVEDERGDDGDQESDQDQQLTNSDGSDDRNKNTEEERGEGQDEVKSPSEDDQPSS